MNRTEKKPMRCGSGMRSLHRDLLVLAVLALVGVNGLVGCETGTKTEDAAG